MSPEQRTAKPTKAISKSVKTEAKSVQLRRELDEARLAHRLQKLDSPVKLRRLRRELARALTRESQGSKEQS